jgi:hypothetical protein
LWPLCLCGEFKPQRHRVDQPLFVYNVSKLYIQNLWKSPKNPTNPKVMY